MDDFAKKEKGLREIIENQKEQLSRYEKKLRGIYDVKIYLCFLLIGSCVNPSS